MVNILVWGCGVIGQGICRSLDFSKCKVFLCDTNIRGTFLVDDIAFDVISPSEIEINKFNFYFPGSEPFEKEIIHSMRKMGIAESRIIPITTDFKKIGRVFDLFTANGFQFILSVQNHCAIEQLNTKLDEITVRQQLLFGILEKEEGNKRGCKNIGIVNLNSIQNIPERVITKCSEKIVTESIDKYYAGEYQIYNIDMLTPDINLLSMCDAIIFAGGGIIKLDSAKMDFPGSIDRITAFAEAYDIPVLFIGVGVEECDIQDRYYKMQRALNRSCVKAITVRENLQAMQKYIFNPNTRVELVADPALIASSVYGVTQKESQVIGIGTINFANWELNGFDISCEKLFDFYENVICEIESRGYEWKLFSNGTRRDYEFAEQIVLRNERYRSHLIPRLKTDYEWMEVMSGFCGIVAPRLHTNIVAFSLGISCVGMVWNNKVKSFYSMINLPNNAFEPDYFDAKAVVEQLFKTKEEKKQYKKDVMFFQKKTVDEIERFIVEYIIQ